MNPAKNRLCAGARSALQTTAALTLLWAAAASWGAEVPLKYNTYYLCNGQRIVIRSCVDQSDKDYNDCIVQFPDRPRMANGQLPGSFALRRNLVTTLQNCREGPAARDIDGTGAVGNGQAPTAASGPGLFSSLYRGATGLFASGWSLFFTLLIGWWIYKRIRNMGFLARRRRRRIIHENNQAALAPFGAGNPYAREKAILEAFDSNNHTFQFEGVNRATKPKVRFVLQRSIKTFKRRDLEALRFAYVAYNRGLLSDEAFHAYRITAIYGDGDTDPAETQFLGMFSFMHRQDPRHAISAARNIVANFANANCQQGLYQHALAAVQAMVQKFPKDELFADMLRRFLEGTRWLGIGDVQRSAFALPDPPTPVPAAVRHPRWHFQDAELFGQWLDPDDRAPRIRQDHLQCGAEPAALAGRGGSLGCERRDLRSDQQVAQHDRPDHPLQPARSAAQPVLQPAGLRAARVAVRLGRCDERREHDAHSGAGRGQEQDVGGSGARPADGDHRRPRVLGAA